MNPTKRLTGVCSECGGSIEFAAELIGTTAQCPRCRKQTELALAAPPDESVVPRKVLIWTAVTVIILVGGLFVTIIGLRHFVKLAASQREQAASNAGAAETNTTVGFRVSAFTLQKGKDGGEGYVIGTVENTLSRARKQVAVEVDLLDDGGGVVEIAKAFRPVLEARAKWPIKMSVAGDSKAVSAKVAAVREGQ
jgi:hypothetical protein